ncbi:MAG: type II secretion system F family protein [Candidatus Aminicenantia bacterium]
MGAFYYFLILIFAGCIAFIIYALFPERKEIAWEIGKKKELIEIDSKLIKIFAPFIKRLSPSFSPFSFFGFKKNIKNLLLRAGIQEEKFNANDFLAYWAIMLVVSILLFLILKFITGVIIALILCAGFASLPYIWLTRMVGKRATEISLALPYFLDIITLTVEAGLDFIVAVDRIIERAKPGPLKDELSIMLSEIRLGSTLQDALRNLSRRTQLKEVAFFVNLMIQSDRVGSPIGKTLRMIADFSRRERLLKAERAGARATTNLLFPLMFLILPANMLIIFGAFGIFLLTKRMV